LKNIQTLLIALLLGLAACQSPALTQNVATQPTMIQSPTATVTLAPTVTSAVTATATDVPFEVCSPLQGFNQADLLARISNPFAPPAPGSDNPHQGVDLGDFDPADPNRVAVTGRSVQAVLPGTVALVQIERFPYGTAVIVETPLDSLPADLQGQFRSLEAWPPRSATDPLTCPAVTPTTFLDDSQHSLYLLYAHLGSLADLQVGDEVGCGQALGTVGQSGNALAPHLHFEARVGPAGARLGSLAHYDVSASVVEMAAYCQWRVSGNFIWVDPLSLLGYLR
jgi:murein DD-endopeptidase MepM/ murein hydrolase activator NlpD